MIPLRITICKTRECQFQFIMSNDLNQILPDLVGIDHGLSFGLQSRMVLLRITICKTRECQIHFIMNNDTNQILPDLVGIDHCWIIERRRRNLDELIFSGASVALTFIIIGNRNGFRFNKALAWSLDSPGVLLLYEQREAIAKLHVSLGDL